MYVTERKNNKGTRYVYRETYKKAGKRLTVSVTLNSSSNHAKKMAAAMLMKKATEKMETEGDKKNDLLQSLTFEQLARNWQQATDMKVKEVTRNHHDQYIRKILSFIEPGLLLADFTPALAEKVIDTMYYLDHLSFSYTKSVLVTMRSILHFAHKAGYIADTAEYDAIRLKRRPLTPQELEKKNNKVLTRKELKSCLEQLLRLDYRVSLAVEFMSLTGLRCGELLALRRQDVSLDKKELKVTGTLLNICKNGDSIQRGTPKNIYSYRTVDLSQRALQILEWFYTDNKRLERWGRPRNSLCSAYTDRGYIFTSRTGQPLNRSYINRLLRKVEIPGKVLHTHIFRHTHISMLLSAGVPLKAVMARVGHNDPKTTMSVYAHVTTEMREQERTALEKLTI